MWLVHALNKWPPEHSRSNKHTTLLYELVRACFSGMTWRGTWRDMTYLRRCSLRWRTWVTRLRQSRVAGSDERTSARSLSRPVRPGRCRSRYLPVSDDDVITNSQCLMQAAIATKGINIIVKLNDNLIKPGRFELCTNPVHRDRLTWKFDFGFISHFTNNFFNCVVN